MLSADEIKAICCSELEEQADSGDLSDDRTKAIDYYYGDMDDYIEVEEDRSRITTRDVMDTIESVLPSLIKIFVEEENAISFMAVSAEDEAQAKLETQAVRSVFFRENDGFLNLYTYLKDALLSKNAIFKTWSEECEYEREEYNGLDPIEANQILNDPTIDYEVEDVDADENGINLVLLAKPKQKKVVVDTVTPEEFGISGDASSIDVKQCRFCWQTTEKTIGDLIKAGYDEDILKDIPIDEDNGTGQQRLARRHLSNETEDTHEHRSMRNVWVTECYPLIDRDEDGLPERLKVTLVGSEQGSYSNATLLDIEDSQVPFSAGTPILLTHKFYGYSLADLVMDIQEMRTVFFRNVYDNIYLANNGILGVNENANIDDLLVRRPGGLARVEGKDHPGNSIAPIGHTPLMPESFGLLQVFDNMQKNRTGVGDEVMGLDSDSLANVNTGVMLQAYDQARMRIELMARILAETGLKQCFSDIHRELHLNNDGAIQLKIDNQWVDVDPRHWKKKRKIEIKVGLGNANKLRRKTDLMEALKLQERASAAGYMTPQHLHNTVSDLMDLNGMDINRYFPNPQTFQPPEKQPDPMLMIEAERVKIEKQRADNDMAKIQSESQLKMLIAQSKEREQAIKAQIDQVNGQMQLQKAVVDEQSQIMRAQNENMSVQVNNEVKLRELDLKEKMSRYEAMLEQQKLEQDNYEAELKSMTTLESKFMDVQQRSEEALMKHIQELTKTLQESERRRVESEERREYQRDKILEYVQMNGSDKVKNFTKTIQ